MYSQINMNIEVMIFPISRGIFMRKAVLFAGDIPITKKKKEELY
jgi:hypothetical protein